MHIHTQRKSVDDRDAMSRYSSQYEANLDPFSAFGAKVLSFYLETFLMCVGGFFRYWWVIDREEASNNPSLYSDTKHPLIFILKY